MMIEDIVTFDYESLKNQDMLGLLCLVAYFLLWAMKSNFQNLFPSVLQWIFLAFRHFIKCPLRTSRGKRRIAYFVSKAPFKEKNPARDGGIA